MKNLSIFINERFWKNHNDKMNKKDIIDCVLAFTGYKHYTDNRQNTEICDEISEYVSRWIDDFNIENIKEIWINAVSDIAYGKLCNLAKKSSSNIDFSKVKSIIDYSEENELLTLISEDGKRYDAYSMGRAITGNKSGLCVEYPWLMIGFMTE